jgi:transcriptional regulator with XRE-family HTH domain
LNRPRKAGAGARARDAREILGFTQGKAAKRFELRRATVTGYEGGKVPLGYLSLLAGCFEDYPAVFRWLREGGLKPRLVPRGLGTEGSPGDPRLAAWAQVEAEMGNYEQRGEAAPTAQLAQWIAQLRQATLAGRLSDAETAVSTFEALEVGQAAAHEDTPRPPSPASSESPPKAAGD